MQIAGFLNDRPWAAWNPFHTDQYGLNKHKSNDDIPQRGTHLLAAGAWYLKRGERNKYKRVDGN